jgi:hypothetical protein
VPKLPKLLHTHLDTEILGVSDGVSVPKLLDNDKHFDKL